VYSVTTRQSAGGAIAIEEICNEGKREKERERERLKGKSPH